MRSHHIRTRSEGYPNCRGEFVRAPRKINSSRKKVNRLEYTTGRVQPTLRAGIRRKSRQSNDERR